MSTSYHKSDTANYILYISYTKKSHYSVAVYEDYTHMKQKKNLNAAPPENRGRNFLAIFKKMAIFWAFFAFWQFGNFLHFFCNVLDYGNLLQFFAIFNVFFFAVLHF